MFVITKDVIGDLRVSLSPKSLSSQFNPSFDGGGFACVACDLHLDFFVFA